LESGDKPVPHWFPYQLRHSAGTEMSRTQGKEKAQHLLTHASIETTEIYDDSALEVREELARNRKNPFSTKSDDGLVNDQAAE
jgi:integrase